MAASCSSGVFPNPERMESPVMDTDLLDLLDLLYLLDLLDAEAMY